MNTKQVYSLTTPNLVDPKKVEKFLRTEKDFGGRKFTFEFNDGTVKECDNVWYQGDITDAHPHWRELMPDNAVVRQ